MGDGGLDFRARGEAEMACDSRIPVSLIPLSLSPRDMDSRDMDSGDMDSGDMDSGDMDSGDDLPGRAGSSNLRNHRLSILGLPEPSKR